MPVQYSSSIGSALAITSGSADGHTPVDSVVQTYDVQAAMGEIAGAGIGTAAAGVLDATAFGENTLATASGSLSVVDHGGAVVTNVDFEAYAAATSDDGSALASTYLGFSYTGGGSYLSVATNATHSSTGIDGSASESSSSLSAVVIDLEATGFEMGGSVLPSVTLEPSQQDVATDAGCGCPAAGGGDTALNIEGNVAMFDVAVFAAGNDTYANLTVDAFALEDQMSSVTVLIDAMIG